MKRQKRRFVVIFRVAAPNIFPRPHAVRFKFVCTDCLDLRTVLPIRLHMRLLFCRIFLIVRIIKPKRKIGPVLITIHPPENTISVFLSGKQILRNDHFRPGPAKTGAMVDLIKNTASFPERFRKDHPHQCMLRDRTVIQPFRLLQKILLPRLLLQFSLQKGEIGVQNLAFSLIGCQAL